MRRRTDPVDENLVIQTKRPVNRDFVLPSTTCVRL